MDIRIPYELTEAEFATMRDLVDKMQVIFEAAKVPRATVIAAMGMAAGEQYPSEKGLREAIEIFMAWAAIAHKFGERIEG